MAVPQQISVHHAEGKQAIVCHTVDEMEVTLDRLHAECEPGHPICVEVVIPGYAIDLGLGTDPTFLCVQVEPCDGEYYLSVGDDSAEGWQDFSGCGNHTPFERKSFVPAALARQALREFVQGQQRSRIIRWRDWAGQPA